MEEPNSEPGSAEKIKAKNAQKFIKTVKKDPEGRYGRSTGEKGAFKREGKKKAAV